MNALVGYTSRYPRSFSFLLLMRNHYRALCQYLTNEKTFTTHPVPVYTLIVINSERKSSIKNGNIIDNSACKTFSGRVSLHTLNYDSIPFRNRLNVFKY